MKAKEITPTAARSGVGACPAIFETDRGTFIVVGSIPAVSDLPPNVRMKLGKGDSAIEIPRNVLPVK